MVPAVLFAVITALYEHVVKSNNTNFPVLLCGCCVVFFLLVYILFGQLDGLREKRRTEASSKDKTWLCFLVLMVLWIPWFVMCFPGNVSYDTGTSVLYDLGIDRSNVNNPFFQNFLFGLVYRIGIVLGDVDRGVSLYVTLQAVVFSLCIALSLTQIKRWGAPNTVVTALLLFYGCCPSFPIYAFTMGKDSNFAIAAFCFAFLLLKLLVEKEKFFSSRKKILYLAVSGVLLGLLRNHGSAIVIVCLLVGVILFLKDDRKNAGRLMVVLTGIGTVLCIAPMLFQAPEGEIRESLSVPLQQTAYYFNHYGDEVTQEELAAVEAVIPVEAFDSYRPAFADPVKAQFRNEASAGEVAAYLKVWFGQFLKHPDAYLKVLYHQSYIYFSPEAMSNVKSHRQWGYDVDAKLFELTDMEDWNTKGLRLAQTIDAYITELPVVGLFQKIGIYTWGLIVIAAYLVYREKYRELLSLLPVTVVLIGCCISPVNGYFRYALPVVVSVPALSAAVIFARK